MHAVLDLEPRALSISFDNGITMSGKLIPAEWVRRGKLLWVFKSKDDPGAHWTRLPLTPPYHERNRAVACTQVTR